ncbi:DUF222 domain-containing protein [Kribbella sp. NPDC048928]|uniref:HNH endonuclease n=1 Tax=Kribbella sp. NPDC048928 TaxID=3364111 RepID=UPI0037176704
MSLGVSRVRGMELLDERAPEMMSDEELVRAIDQEDLALAQHETRRLRLIADLDQRGYAERVGARDTIQFIEYRYRLDHHRARRDVLLARALPKYPLISAALPNRPTSADPTAEGASADPTDEGGDPTASGDGAEPAAEASAGVDGADSASGSSDSADRPDGSGSDGGSDGSGSAGGSGGGGVPGLRFRPAQAEAIVFPLEKLPSTVPVEDLEVAERELLRLARHLAPSDLRKSAQEACNILDTDGPEPAEEKAAARESLTLTNADHGVKFKGYLANDNAELLRTLITAGARPHKTLDGDLDPRPREKRQADALSTTLTLAATALDAGTPSPTIPRPTTPNPTTPNPTTSNPTTSNPTTSNPTTSNPTTSNPTPPNPTAPNPTAPNPTAPNPTALSPAAPDPGASDPTASSHIASNLAAPGPTAPLPFASGRVWSGGVAAGLGGLGGVGVGGLGKGQGCGVAGDVVPGFGAKANLTVTIDLEDLKAATADAIGDTVYGNGLSAATIRRLACDANVIPIVLGSNSEPLDVGRRERLVTRAMRRALNTRDRGCVVCGAPPVMCDAHHLISWVDGGETKLNNLALLCRRHHADLHNGHWTITITNGTVHVTRPHWADPPPHADLPQTPASPASRPHPPHDSYEDDSRAHDSRAHDSRAHDSGVRDSGVRDSRVDDSGVRDSRVRDSRVDDSGVQDSRVQVSHPYEPGVHDPRSTVGRLADADLLDSPPGERRLGGLPPDEPPPDGRRSDEPPSDGPPSDGPPSDGRRSDGPPSDGSSSGGRRSVALWRGDAGSREVSAGATQQPEAPSRQATSAQVSPEGLVEGAEATEFWAGRLGRVDDLWPVVDRRWLLDTALGRKVMRRLREENQREEFTEAELQAAIAAEVWGEATKPPGPRTVRAVARDHPSDAVGPTAEPPSNALRSARSPAVDPHDHPDQGSAGRVA